MQKQCWSGRGTNGNKNGGGGWELQPACLLAGSLVQEKFKETESGNCLAQNLGTIDCTIIPTLRYDICLV